MHKFNAFLFQALPAEQFSLRGVYPEAVPAVKESLHNGIAPQGSGHPESMTVKDIGAAAVHKAYGFSGRTHCKMEAVLRYGGPFRRAGKIVGESLFPGIVTVYAPVCHNPQAGVTLLHYIPYDVVPQRSRFIGRWQEYPHSFRVPAVEAIPCSKPHEGVAVLPDHIYGTVGQSVGVGDALYVVFGHRRVPINSPEQR